MDDDEITPGHSDEDPLVAPEETPLLATDADGFDTDVVWAPPLRPRWTLRQRAIFLLIVAATATLYFARLAQPSRLLTDGFKSGQQCQDYPVYKTSKCWEMIPLDEVHYIPDSRDVLRFGTESDQRADSLGKDGAYVVHPPAGKWFIAIGIWLFGDQPFGWRFFGALFGVLGVLSMYMLALRLWRSHWWASMAAIMLACDGLWFVQSRVAMLDIYAASWLLAGVWLVVEDRDRARPEHRGFRWWRLGAALCFGMATASKYPLETLVFVLFTASASARWEAMKVPFAGRPRPARNRVAAILGTFVVVPALVYVASYTPWFLDSHRYNPPNCVNVQAPGFLRVFGLQGTGRVLEQWGCYQAEILNFHRHLEKYEANTTTQGPSASGTTPSSPVAASKPAHPYFGNAWAWPWIGRPVAHFFETVGPKDATKDQEVVGIPNPAIWWVGFFIALPMLIWWTVRRSDDLSGILLAFFLGGWLPYVAADAINRPVFMFYATPLVPFIVLSIVHVWNRATWRAPELWALPTLYLLLVMATFTYFYPVLAGFPIAPDGFFGWHGHMWLEHDCASSFDTKIKILCWI